MKKINLFICLTILLLTSCSSWKLDNDEATKLVMNISPKEVTGTKVIIKRDYFTIYSGLNIQSSQDLLNKFQADLAKAGLIKHRVTKVTQEETFSKKRYYGYCYSADLTELARKLVVSYSPSDVGISLSGSRNCGQSALNIKAIVIIGYLNPIRLKDIFQEDGSKEAQLVYEVKFEPTAFYKITDVETKEKYSPGNTYEFKVKAKKYDNGWQIEQ